MRPQALPFVGFLCGTHQGDARHLVSLREMPDHIERPDLAAPLRRVWKSVTEIKNFHTVAALNSSAPWTWDIGSDSYPQKAGDSSMAERLDDLVHDLSTDPGWAALVSGIAGLQR